MKFRYVGPEDQVDLSIPGAFISCPRGQWIDPVEAAEAVYVPADHMQVVVLGLVDSPDWEVEGVATSRPVESAAKAAWVAFAVAQGWTEADAKKATKAELIEALAEQAAPSDPAPPNDDPHDPVETDEPQGSTDDGVPSDDQEQDA